MDDGWSPHILSNCDKSIIAVHDYWDGKRSGRSMPSRKDIDPLELRPYLSNLMLLDVVPDERRYVYRLVGTRETSLRGRDPTGHSVAECYFGESLAEALAFYDRVALTCEPALYRGVYRPDAKRRVHEEIIYLPLSNDGASVNMIMVYTHLIAVVDLH